MWHAHLAGFAVAAGETGRSPLTGNLGRGFDKVIREELIDFTIWVKGIRLWYCLNPLQLSIIKILTKFLFKIQVKYVRNTFFCQFCYEKLDRLLNLIFNKNNQLNLKEELELMIRPDRSFH
jgi:hypothetical protein